MEVATSITPNSKEFPTQVNVNVTSKGNIGSIVIGDGNLVLDSSRRLEMEKVISIEVKPPSISLMISGRDRSGSKRMRKQRKIPYAQRKRRPHSKSRSSSSEEEIARRLCSREVFPAVLGDEKSLSLKKLYGIVNRLHPLRDGGNWKEFDMEAKSILLEKKGDLATEIFVLLEQSVVVSYQNDFERSEAMVFKGLEMLKNANLDEHHFLASTAYINLMGIYRHQNKHGDAQRCLDTAFENAKHVTSKYLQGASYLTTYISSMPSSHHRRAILVEKAKNIMKHCISLCDKIECEGVYIRKHHFGLPKLALMCLNCRTRITRSEPVDSATIQYAKHCIEEFEDKYKENLSQGARIQLLVAKSDLHFRLNKFRTAEIDAMHALETAKKSGFSLEIDPLEDRLKDISRLICKREEGRIVPEPRQFGNSSPSLSSSTSPSRRNSPSSSDCEMQEL